MILRRNKVYGIVYRFRNGRRIVLNGRVVGVGRTHFRLKHMNYRGALVILTLRNAGIVRAVEY